MQSRLGWYTYANVVIQVVADRKIDPLVRRDHGRAINSRAIHDLQLVGRADATCTA